MLSLRVRGVEASRSLLMSFTYTIYTIYDYTMYLLDLVVLFVCATQSPNLLDSTDFPESDRRLCRNKFMSL